MNHDHQVQNICKVAFFHIYNLSKIRKCVTQKDAETLVHAFVTAKLDIQLQFIVGWAASILIR